MKRSVGFLAAMFVWAILAGIAITSLLARDGIVFWLAILGFALLAAGLRWLRGKGGRHAGA